jgi:hypothetical protein
VVAGRTGVERERRREPPYAQSRLEAAQPLPEEVVSIAARYVDVLSFQYFSTAEAIVEAFSRWHRMTGKPTLLADAAVPGRRELSLSYDEQAPLYAPMMERLFAEPCIVGWHYCGAYVENHARGFGLLAGDESPRAALLAEMTRKNHEITRRVQSLAGGDVRIRPLQR